MDTERNLLFGVVAFQNGAVDADALAETCASMAAEPTTGLGDMLVRRGLMTDEQKADLEATVAHELASHGGDPHATLAATLDGRSREAMSGLAGASGLFDPAGVPAPAGPAGQGGHVVLESLSPGDADSRERYTLTHLHAKGGMGRVWLARDGSLGRQIALKELRPDQTDNTIVCSRFLYEAKITAQLEHPGIVPVYELSEGDVPYYTMRFVRGRTLSEAIRAYHKRRAAGEADPVELHDLLTAFVDVCNAVAYAHSRGIIHRDLKGQNVVLGDFGEHIVLDWGLAKRVGPDPARPPAPQPAAPTEAMASDRLVPEAATAVTCAAPALDDHLTPPDDLDDATSPGTFAPGEAGSGYGSNGSAGAGAGAGGHNGQAGSSAGREVPESGAGPEGTMQGQLLGTPAYMAPEQARARHDLVDQRTDIYGLGAILYEILVGRPPFVAPKTSEIIRKVCNEAPTPPRQVVPTVAPGIEAVCLKAIRKEKADRYQSAAELGQEVRRHLADEPVLAYAEPWTQKAMRWARRHRTRVAAGVATLAVATVALACSTWVISGERREAETQGEQARQAVNLLARGADIAFDDQLDPMQKEILENALAYYAKFTGRASGKPEVRLEHGQAWRQMGDFQRKLGRLAESEAAYEKAIGLLEPLAAGGGDGGIAVEARRSLARTRTLLGDLLVHRGADRGRADVLYRQALEAQLALAGDAKKKGNDKAAAAAAAATIDDVVRLGQTFKSQGELQRLDGKFADARATFGKAIAELERALAADARHPEARNELAASHEVRGVVGRELNEPKAAEQDYRRAIELLEKLVAEFPTVSRHREVLAKACNNLGWLLQEAGRPAEAEAFLRREVALARRLTEDYPDRTECRRELARGLYILGDVLLLEGQIAEAEPLVREAVAVNSAIHAKSPEDVPVRLQLAVARHDLGQVLMRQGKPEAALESLEAASKEHAALAREFPDRPKYRLHVADTQDSIALALSALGRPGVDEAFRRASETYEKLVADHPENVDYRVRRATSLRNQGAVLADAGKPEKAEAVLNGALALLDSRDAKDRPADWRRRQAEILINIGGLKRPGAEDALRRSIAISAELAGKPSPAAEDLHNLAIAELNMAEVLVAVHRAPEAGPFYERSVADFHKLVDAAPRAAQFRNHFGVVLASQGAWFDGAGKTPEARSALTAAVEQQRQAVKLSNNAPPYRLAVAEHLIALADVDRKLGAYEESARVALEVPRAVPPARRAQACFDAARALARLVAQIGADRKVPEKERDYLARVYLTRTVVLLRDAVDADPALAGPIKADRDIKVLQSRPEFQAILNTLVEAVR